MDDKPGTAVPGGLAAHNRDSYGQTETTMMIGNAVGEREGLVLIVRDEQRRRAGGAQQSLDVGTYARSQ